MTTMRKVLFSTFVALTLTFKVFPAIIGGEIKYYKVSESMYKFEVVTLNTNTLQDSIQVNYGDGTISTIGKTVSINRPNYIETIYWSYHSYSDYGSYTVSVEVGNWQYGIRNFPPTVIPFSLKTKVNYYNAVFSSTPGYWLNDGLTDTAFIGQPYTFDPVFFNHDNDSIFFRLIDCIGEDTSSILGYMLPPGMTIDNSSGVITWNTPPDIGVWAIAYTVETWRNGHLIVNFIRQMTITVTNQSSICINHLINKVNVFPNPTTGSIYIGVDNVKKVMVYNTLGKCVTSLESANEINFKGFEKGIYFIRIFTDNNMLEEKIILE
jgi:hypothetical protein